MPSLEPHFDQSVTIERLGAKGDGVSSEGIFVTGALPGETVEGHVIEGRIEKPRITVPSVSRVRPPCRHAKTCGGCTLQHAKDDFVAKWKTETLVAALQKAGLESPLRPIQTSPAGSRRRATLSGRRLKAGAVVGFHARASDTVVAIPDCRLIRRAIYEVIPTLEEIVRAGCSRRGEVTLVVTDTDGGVDVSVNGGRDLDVGLGQLLANITRATNVARLTWNGETVVKRRETTISMADSLVPIPPGAFLQATEDGQAALIAATTEILEGSKRVIDLFAGAGTFTLSAARYAEVLAIEAEADHLAALDHGWRHSRGLKSVTTQTRDLFRDPVLVEDLVKFGGAIIDPPRAGALAQITQLAASRLSRVAYVSCNSATFARDAKVLSDGGFTLNWVQPVDQFRWSPHLELAASFSRNPN